ncbi:MAG TPA: hypothetical protein VNB90_08485 [Cytophagaceae bacterium]|jgi:hypothetical protein|nr:hypothetical protein [Cytophagaceae bacterium]
MVEVDKTLYPIIIFRSLPVEVSDQDLEEYLMGLEKILREAPEKLVIIHDINKSRFLSGDQLSRIRKWSLDSKALFDEKTLATGVVSSSVLSSLIIKAIRFLLKSNFTSEIFSNMDTALSWAKKRLNEK